MAEILSTQELIDRFRDRREITEQCMDEAMYAFILQRDLYDIIDNNDNSKDAVIEMLDVLSKERKRFIKMNLEAVIKGMN